MRTLRARVLELHAAGLSAAAIARRLGVAPATVAYHLRRADDQVQSRRGAARGTHDEPANDVIVVSTRERVRELLAQGRSRVAIANALGVSKATVTYHARRLGAEIDERCARRYDWTEVQRYYNAGHSVRECVSAFGFSAASWSDAVKRGEIVARPASLPDEEFFVDGTYRGRFNLKARLIRDGLRPERCGICGLREWHEAPITLALHHINGIRNDNRLENLQLLCPNCHSQTENFAGRNHRLPSA